MAEATAIRDQKPCTCTHGKVQHYPANFEQFTRNEAPCWQCDCRVYEADTAAHRLLRKLLDREQAFITPGGALLVIDPIRLDALDDDERELVATLYGPAS